MSLPRSQAAFPTEQIENDILSEKTQLEEAKARKGKGRGTRRLLPSEGLAVFAQEIGWLDTGHANGRQERRTATMRHECHAGKYFYGQSGQAGIACVQVPPTSGRSGGLSGMAGEGVNSGQGAPGRRLSSPHA